MTLSESVLQVYIGFLFCAVVFSSVMILTVWIVDRSELAQRKGEKS